MKILALNGWYFFLKCGSGIGAIPFHFDFASVPLFIVPVARTWSILTFHATRLLKSINSVAPKPVHLLTGCWSCLPVAQQLTCCPVELLRKCPSKMHGRFNVPFDLIAVPSTNNFCRCDWLRAAVRGSLQSAADENDMAPSSGNFSRQDPPLLTSCRLMIRGLLLCERHVCHAFDRGDTSLSADRKFPNFFLNKICWIIRCLTSRQRTCVTSGVRFSVGDVGFV